jgi:hypothetical protein
MKKLLLSVIVLSTLQIKAQSLSGTLDSSFEYPNATNQPIYDVDVQSNGKILISQNPTSKRLNADGSVDNTFVPAFSGTQMIIHPNGSIYSFGSLTRRLTSTGADAGDIGMNFTGGGIKAAVLAENGSMILAGKMTTFAYANQPLDQQPFTVNILKISEDLMWFPGYSPGTGFNNDVETLEYDAASGKLYVGGQFTSFNGTAANYICRLNADGTLDATFDVGTGVNDMVRDITILEDGRILVVGKFTEFDGTAVQCKVVLSNTGTIDPTFISPASTVSQDIYTALQLANGNIIMAGSLVNNYRIVMTDVNGNTVNNNTFNPNNCQTDMSIYNLTQPEPGKLLIGGWFNTVNSIDRKNLAQLFVCEENLSNVVTFDGSTLTAETAGATYQWILVDNSTETETPIAGATNQTFTPTTPGYYYAQITSGNCFTRSNQMNLSSLDLNENEIATFSIYPNPALDQVTISNIEAGSTITLMDVSGKSVSQQLSNSTSVKLQTSELTSGVYFVRVMNNNGISGTQKLLIE